MIGPLCTREQKYVIGCNTHITKPSARVPPRALRLDNGAPRYTFQLSFPRLRLLGSSIPRGGPPLSLFLSLSREIPRETIPRESPWTADPASGSASLLCRTLQLGHS